MSAKKPAGMTSLPPTSQLATLGAWMEFAEEVYERGQLALGQITDNAHDEALYLFLRTLDWSLESGPEVLEKPLAPAQRIALREVLQARAIKRVPAAYLLREAWLGGLCFYVDERVIIPRSYFVELIPRLADLLATPEAIRRAVDVCTGSACLAILLARAYPEAEIHAVDLSPEALAVARRNVSDHGLADRLCLCEGDTYEPLPEGRYDLILSNPPYEPAEVMAQIPAEFLHEPRMSLGGGDDGLDVVRKLLAGAPDRLQPNGVLIMEVGGLRKAMENEWPELDMNWLPVSDGSWPVCLITANELKKQFASENRKKARR